jgi:hypothetical protein
MANDSTRTAIARVEENLKAVVQNTEPLPELIKLVAKHDERIRSHWIHLVAIWSVLAATAVIVAEVYLR